MANVGPLHSESREAGDFTATTADWSFSYLSVFVIDNGMSMFRWVCSGRANFGKDAGA
jgi:hypothetical protein